MAARMRKSPRCVIICRYREHLEGAVRALLRRTADGGGSVAVRNLLVANLGPAWVDDPLYELYGRCQCANRLLLQNQYDENMFGHFRAASKADEIHE